MLVGSSLRFKSQGVLKKSDEAWIFIYKFIADNAHHIVIRFEKENHSQAEIHVRLYGG